MLQVLNHPSARRWRPCWTGAAQQDPPDNQINVKAHLPPPPKTIRLGALISIAAETSTWFVSRTAQSRDPPAAESRPSWLCQPQCCDDR